MAIEGFGTTTEEMDRAGRHVLSVNQTVQTDLSTLRVKLDPLRAAWKGAAAVQFTALMQRWDNDARQLNEALRSIGEAIQGSASTYVQQDEAQSSSLSAIRTALG
jgi:WXG100 family type VII secretion target